MLENYAAVKAINPVVYNSAERACHWSAFFLAVKGEGTRSEEWIRFFKAINARYHYDPGNPDANVYPEHSYKTPRLWIAN
jgi:hypothetical protein